MPGITADLLLQDIDDKTWDRSFSELDSFLSLPGQGSHVSSYLLLKGLGSRKQVISLRYNTTLLNFKENMFWHP